MVAAEEGAQGTPPKGASTRIARVALEALAFPSKWTGFGGLSAQAIKERQHGLAAWLNGVLDLVAENVTAEELAAFLRPVETVEALWTEAGPLGVNFAKDLTVLATSPATQKTHPQLVPGLELVSVQNTTVVGGAYAATIELLRTAGRPLTLVLVDRSATTPSVDRVEVTSASSGSDDSGKDFVAFTVRCFSSQRGTWVLTKRFSEFSALRDCLLRDAAEASPPSVDRLKGLLHLGAATTAEPSIALYVCTRKTIARTSCELDSEPLQAVYPGDELEAVEVRENGDGAVRIRCRLRDADLLWGWCTATNKDGLVILERRSLARVVRVTITDTETHYDDAKQEYVSYVLNCEGDLESWTIAKRFSDFTALRDRLAAKGLSELANEQFPSKVSLFGRWDDSVVEKRKSALQRWVSKLLDWTHDDFDLQRFLQDDGSWPPQSQFSHTTSSPPRDAENLELSVAHYYRSHSHTDVNAPDRGPRHEMPLINYYKQCGDSDSADKKPTGFFGGVFENSIFSRLAASQSHVNSQESTSEPEPEPELDQERERAPGTNFIHSVLGRLSPFDRAGAEEGSEGKDGPPETAARGAFGRDELGREKAETDFRDENDNADSHRPLIPVKRLKVASYQMRTDEKTGKEFTVYQVKCFPVDALATAPWVVSRRFSAFSDLRESLGSAIAKIPFPSRHMSLSLWGTNAPSQVELDERRLELEVWLISVLGLRQNDEHVLRFLNDVDAPDGAPVLSLDTSHVAPSAISLHSASNVGATAGVQDATDPGTPIGVYRCVRRTVVRESFESWSEKMGILEEGVEVKVLEERLNAEGVLRARFVSTGVDLMGGWCSVRTAGGQTILDLTFRQ